MSQVTKLKVPTGGGGGGGAKTLFQKIKGGGGHFDSSIRNRVEGFKVVRVLKRHLSD